MHEQGAQAHTSTALLMLPPWLPPWLPPSCPSSSGAGWLSAGCRLCSSEKRASATRAYATRCGHPMSAPLAWQRLSSRASSTIFAWLLLPGPASDVVLSADAAMVLHSDASACTRHQGSRFCWATCSVSFRACGGSRGQQASALRRHVVTACACACHTPMPDDQQRSATGMWHTRRRRAQQYHPMHRRRTVSYLQSRVHVAKRHLR
jgi:hypothetical protein